MYDWKRLPASHIVALVASCTTVLASFLPWVVAFGFVGLGIEGDGMLSAFLAGLAALLLLVPRASAPWFALVSNSLGFLVCLVSLLLVPLEFMGFGLPLATMAAGIATVATFLAARSHRPPLASQGELGSAREA